MKTRRPRMALPHTVLTEPDTVRLVAGEDFRYTLKGPGLDRWLPDLLAECDGSRSLAELLDRVEPHRRAAARGVIERAYGERILVDGTAAEAHVSRRPRLAVEGSGLLSFPEAEGESVPVLCQDRLDYAEALAFNRRGLKGSAPWLWVTTGPMSRGYVSPLFLPDAGPCLGCLLRHFQRLSPAPELYDALIEHGREGRPFAETPFPEEGVEILRRLTLWKAGQMALETPSPALYRLHVLEVGSMEVTAHRVFVDPECPECSDDAVV